jgi:hypothetical protein
MRTWMMLNRVTSAVIIRPMTQKLELDVVCVAGPNNKLNIPYCTSWRQPGKNAVSISPTEASPVQVQV